ncbi:MULTISPECIES: ATP-binding protein [unclassified Streptomyces]|uniref:ATP-binding protein n=1 Tax=unclassified Streptomyces TaxID=2593676 RepID=UPI00344F917A
MTDDSMAPVRDVSIGAAPVGDSSGVGASVPRTAAEARDRVETLLDKGIPGRENEPLDTILLADVLLVTSELVTNAIRHGGGLTAFDARLSTDGLTLCVDDASLLPPVVTRPADRGRDGTGGFGWPLIRCLAKHVAVTQRPGGKRITAFIAFG